ncbi:MAG: leucyl aminopeptidase [Acidobacteria bacterium]|nr:leucyl aminopeptidase [Acidobacteriota bacterium]
MKIRVTTTEWDRYEGDVLAIPVFEDEAGEFAASLDAKIGGLIEELKGTQEWTGRQGESTILYRPAGLKVGRLLLVGAGKRASFNVNVVRSIANLAFRRIKGSSFKRAAFLCRDEVDPGRAVQAVTEGLILASYDGDDYKTEDKSRTLVEEIHLLGKCLDESAVDRHIERGEILAYATNSARRIINEPGNRMNPRLLAEKAQELSEKYGIGVEVWGEPELKKNGMNAVMAVAQGSDEPARFIILRHQGGAGNEPPIVFVGKGVTFDSGGLSLKPAQSMEEMKSDKAGACAVLGALQAIAQLRVKKNVVGLIPAVENLPSGRAQRPGDVIHSMSGKTIEVINTDAEGRLILADALHYASSLNPQFVVDIATLTGACVVALGHVRAGLFCNDEDLFQRIMRASEQTGEKLWRLPLDDEYRKEIRSEIADMKNVGSRSGGAITAAKFLQEFVGSMRWCHIDMAGVDLFKDGQEGKGATGFGVRTLAQLALDEDFSTD